MEVLEKIEFISGWMLFISIIILIVSMLMDNCQLTLTMFCMFMFWGTLGGVSSLLSILFAKEMSVDNE